MTVKELISKVSTKEIMRHQTNETMTDVPISNMSGTENLNIILINPLTKSVYLLSNNELSTYNPITINELKHSLTELVIFNCGNYKVYIQSSPSIYNDMRSYMPARLICYDKIMDTVKILY
jgi:hypothetical protein